MNFESIWAAFGDVGGGGCPACFRNVVNFWCEYTCSPRQAEFVATAGLATKTDPVSGSPFIVETFDVSLDTATACGMFDSCASTGKVKEFSPLQTCEGFMTYQGQTEAIQTGLTFITCNYTTPERAAAAGRGVLANALHSCCNYPANIGPDNKGALNVTNTSCPCASCAGMCAGGRCSGGGSQYAGLGQSPDDPLNGFDGDTVAIVAGFVGGMSVFIVAWRSMNPDAAHGGGGGGSGGLGEYEEIS